MLSCFPILNHIWQRMLKNKRQISQFPSTAKGFWIRLHIFIYYCMFQCLPRFIDITTLFQWFFSHKVWVLSFQPIFLTLSLSESHYEENDMVKNSKADKNCCLLTQIIYKKKKKWYAKHTIVQSDRKMKNKKYLISVNW